MTGAQAPSELIQPNKPRTEMQGLSPSPTTPCLCDPEQVTELCTSVPSSNTAD